MSSSEFFRDCPLRNTPLCCGRKHQKSREDWQSREFVINYLNGRREVFNSHLLTDVDTFPNDKKVFPLSEESWYTVAWENPDLQDTLNRDYKKDEDQRSITTDTYHRANIQLHAVGIYTKKAFYCPKRNR